MIQSVPKCQFVVLLVWVLGISAAPGFAQGPRVLLLGDDGSEGQVNRALRAAGHDVESGGPYYEWDGVDPDVSEFDVVVYLDGYEYGYGLLPAADAALSAFVAGGGGLVISEWSAYDVYQDYMSPGVAALMPVTAPIGDYGYGSDWIVLDPAHPLAAWLPAVWGDSAGFSYVVPHYNATVVIESAEGNPLVTYRNDRGGTVVHVNHDLTYTTEMIHWQALQVLVNAVEFAHFPIPADCNHNGVPDYVDVSAGTSRDRDGNHVLDECDPDCNGNGVPDDLDVEPSSGFSLVDFEFDATSPGEWDYVASCYGCFAEETALPFPLVLGGETFTRFLMSSEGYVELLRPGDVAYAYGYGAVMDLIGDGDPHHTFLMAAYDDLDSSYLGGFGYRTEPGRIVFYWETQTNEDADGVYTRASVFQIVVESDGSIQWNFASSVMREHGYDLFSGVHLGYGLNELYTLASNMIPTRQSWVFTGPAPAFSDDVNFNGEPDECEPDCNGNGLPDDLDTVPPIPTGLSKTLFSFVGPKALAWSDACDTCDSGAVALPFAVTLGAETYTAFRQTSDGCVELLRAGESPYGFSYGPVESLISYTGGNPGNPRHTFLLAAFDDLASDYGGTFGYWFEDSQVVFYWYTETYEDEDSGLFNEFEIVLSADGVVRWNFALVLYAGYGYDLFSGLYLGHGAQTLYEIARGRIPDWDTWVYTETELSGGGSEDVNTNGIPDECEGRGDMNDDGVVDLSDLPGFLDCLEGPSAAIDEACQRADFDNDADVDLHDAAGFCAALSE